MAVEEGLRSFGTEKHAFGKFAMDNETEWHNQKLNWKKRECFIAMARYVSKVKSYSKYIHFKWSDFVTRSQMTKTFNNRHLPYSTGRSRLKELLVPKNWSSPVDRRKRKRSSNEESDTTPCVVTDVIDESPAKTVTDNLTWDSEEDEWVQS